MNDDIRAQTRTAQDGSGAAPEEPGIDGPDGTVPESAADVRGSVAAWLRQARGLAADWGLDNMVSAFDVLAQARGRSRFRVAVVGEFNRGKSTLINRLIGREVLPTGAATLTCAAIILRAGSQEGVQLTWPDGRQEEHPGDAADAWRKLAESQNSVTAPGSSQGAPTVTVTVADSWLSSVDAELVETPGVNSGADAQFDRARHAVAASDAALFILSAVSPLSITERHLLEEEILSRHMPLTAVVVSMVDLLPGEEREEALQALRVRLAELPGDLPVLLAPSQEDGTQEIAQLRALIEKYVQDSNLALWRNRQITAQLADYCDALARIATERATACVPTAAEREELQQRAVAQQNAQAKEWNGLRLEMTGRQLTLAARVRGSIQEARTTMIEDLRWDLERSPNPREWWQRDLPILVRHRLEALAKQEERLILSTIAEDVAWLDAEVVKRIPTAPISPRPERLGLLAEVDVGTDSGDIRDLGKMKLVARVSAQGGAIVGYMVAAARHVRMPMIYGGAFSLIGGLLAEVSLRSATEQQRREVYDVLVQVVDQSAASFADQATEALAEHYAEILDQLRETHLAWQTAQLAAVSAEPPPDEERWGRLAADASRLAETIHAGLRGEGIAR